MATYKILFIDDDPDVLRSMGDYFERQGHQVFRAPSGEEGIDVWEREKPEVTILDLHMPGMTGMEVLGQLRKKRAVVLMLTGYGDIDSAVQAMKLGAENFLTKPIEMSHLVQAVEKAAEKQALRREVVELRAKVKPNLKRRLIRVGMLAVLLAASVGLGTWIGTGGDPDVRPRSPIPIPLDSAPEAPAPSGQTNNP